MGDQRKNLRGTIRAKGGIDKDQVEGFLCLCQLTKRPLNIRVDDAGAVRKLQFLQIRGDYGGGLTCSIDKHCRSGTARECFDAERPTAGKKIEDA